MPQPNDLSRSLVALDQNSTIIAVIELSQSGCSLLPSGESRAAAVESTSPGSGARLRASDSGRATCRIAQC
jgi:hypothetical protein